MRLPVGPNSVSLGIGKFKRLFSSVFVFHCIV
ncbi:hypothetical protein T09_2823 [Trichinella sp. T9]|nr:hypothetical protein T09_2823 [Trichinella sp. T9]